MFFGTIGPLEILVIVLLVVIIFGAKRLPQLGSGLGQGIRNFKKSVSGEEDKTIKNKAE
ncbi:MAG: twin-arginine translocase TatA/TatE family subunit [Acidobacteriota bacterium]|nr:twin-arginine translocase TatA/TatE family subunit [Acidobacteriota bacterium]